MKQSKEVSGLRDYKEQIPAASTRFSSHSVVSMSTLIKKDPKSQITLSRIHRTAYFKVNPIQTRAK